MGGCCVGQSALDIDFIESLELPVVNPRFLMRPFTLPNTEKNRDQAQLMFSALWERRDLEWDFKFLAPSLSELEKIFRDLPKYLRIEWIVQILVLIKECREDTQFRKILFLVIGLFIDTMCWPGKPANLLYIEFLRKRIEEADYAIFEYCRDAAVCNPDVGRSGVAGSPVCLSPGGAFVEHAASTAQLVNASRCIIDMHLSTKHVSKIPTFEDALWAYELKHTCEYKLRDFLTLDETPRKCDKVDMSTCTFSSDAQTSFRRAKPVLLEIHGTDGTVRYRKMDVDTSAGFKESIISAFGLPGVPEEAELFEIFCDGRQTLQKLPFSFENNLLRMCLRDKVKHFHYYVYKPHRVDFLNNVGEKVSIHNEIFSLSMLQKIHMTLSQKLNRVHLVSEDLANTFFVKYADGEKVPTLFKPNYRQSMFTHDDLDAACQASSAMVIRCQFKGETHFDDFNDEEEPLRQKKSDGLIRLFSSRRGTPGDTKFGVTVKPVRRWRTMFNNKHILNKFGRRKYVNLSENDNAEGLISCVGSPMPSLIEKIQ